LAVLNMKARRTKPMLLVSGVKRPKKDKKRGDTKCGARNAFEERQLGRDNVMCAVCYELRTKPDGKWTGSL
jgi:hypothetical protein